MAEYRIQGTTLDAIADAINAKTGGSSAMTPAEMVTEIGSISGGETIEHGIKAEAINSNGYATEITVIGDIIYYPCARSSSSLAKVNAPDAVCVVGDALRDLTNANMSPLTLPKAEYMSGVNGIYNCFFPQIYLPLFHTNPANATSSAGQIYDTKLTYIEFGSIGHPVIKRFNINFFRGNSQAFDCVIFTEKTTFAEAQALFYGAPWSATNATIIYKNSVTGEVLT